MSLTISDVTGLPAQASTIEDVFSGTFTVTNPTETAQTGSLVIGTPPGKTITLGPGETKDYDLVGELTGDSTIAQIKQGGSVVDRFTQGLERNDPGTTDKVKRSSNWPTNQDSKPDDSRKSRWTLDYWTEESKVPDAAPWGGISLRNKLREPDVKKVVIEKTGQNQWSRNIIGPNQGSNGTNKTRSSSQQEQQDRITSGVVLAVLIGIIIVVIQ